MRRRGKIGFAMLVASILVTGACAWVGYGNPFREIAAFDFRGSPDLSHAFFIEKCDADRLCALKPQHRRVIHFSFGDGMHTGPGNINGEGWNPIVMLREVGLKFLPVPDYAAAAIKWCTNAEISQFFSYHGQLFIVPLTKDPLSTARCVREQLPRPFSVMIADPMGGNGDHEPFRSLIN